MIRTNASVVGKQPSSLVIFPEGTRYKKTKASQGEKSLFFSILKKSESIIVEKETKKDPIILLDDVFSKLDIKNTNLVLSLFKKNPQTIITHTKKIENLKINQIQIDA